MSVYDDELEDVFEPLRRIALRSAYERESGPARPGVDVGRLASPAVVQKEMNAVNAGALRLDAEIKAADVAPNLKRAWASFFEEWKRFYSEHAGYWSRLTPMTSDETLEYKRRLDDWRRALASASAPPAAPVPAAPPPTSPPAKPRREIEIPRIRLPETPHIASTKSIDGFPWIAATLAAGGVVVLLLRRK